MASKFALVIANTDYQDSGLAKLTAPGKDAEEFARVLREPELVGFDEVQVLLNESVEKTRRAVARFFANRKPDDLLLMYFSGHGVRDDAGRLFLAAHDTEIDLLDATGLPAEFVTSAMNNSRSRRQLLILDCCNSGAFAQGTKSSAALGQSMGTAQAFEGNGYGRMVLTATDSTQFAWEGDKVLGDTQQSVFTHFLIEGLHGAADRDGDGRITVDELYDYAYEQVVSHTPKQTPGKWTYKQQGEFVLRENLKPREVKPARLTDTLVELLSSSSLRARNLAIQDLTKLLDGDHPGLARAAEEKLREIAANDDSLKLRITASDILASHQLSPDLSAFPPLAEREPEKVQVKPAPQQPASVSALPLESPPAVTQKKPAAQQPAPRIETRKPGPAPRVKPALPIWAIFGGIGLFALVVISLLGWGISNLILSSPTSSPTVMLIPTSTVDPSLGIGSTWTSPKDGMTMVYIPAGDFIMGDTAEQALVECQKDRSDCQLSWFKDEEPPHQVNLDSYWMDQTEVTNARYAKCVDAAQCDPPSSSKSNTHDSYYGNSQFDDYPVIYVSWSNANAYCEWRGNGTRLPTEAEWEKAAGWDGDKQVKHVYPWGDSIDCSFANFWPSSGACQGDTTKVGSYPWASSFYGLLDMAGNVWEWVMDWYDSNYYSNSTASNPQGPSSGSDRVMRGGSWYYLDDFARSSYRSSFKPALSYNNIGFRCARSQ